MVKNIIFNFVVTPRNFIIAYVIIKLRGVTTKLNRKLVVCLCHCVERRTCCDYELKMSGISRSFNVPSFIKSKKRKISHSLPII